MERDRCQGRGRVLHNRMRGIRKLALLGGLLPLLLALGPVSPASAGHVTCGTVITANTVLDSDVGPCPAGVLRVTASNITLDLNGHRVLGGPQPGDGTGILLFRVSGVTVRNGTVTNFDMGVAIEGGSANTVTGINARDNIGSASTNGGDGIAILSSRNNRIVGNSTVNNGTLSGIGLYSDVDSAHPRATSGPSTGNVIDSNQVLN